MGHSSCAAAAAVVGSRSTRRNLTSSGGRSWPPIPRIGTLAHVGRNTSFSLDEHFSAFIEDEVASGRYGSASDVVRSALRLLEDREIRLRALRQALIAGEQSGASTPFDFDEFVARKRAEEPHHR